jgi:hypothetical protein
MKTACKKKKISSRKNNRMLTLGSKCFVFMFTICKYNDQKNKSFSGNGTEQLYSALLATSASVELCSAILEPGGRYVGSKL